MITIVACFSAYLELTLLKNEMFAYGRRPSGDSDFGNLFAR